MGFQPPGRTSWIQFAMIAVPFVAFWSLTAYGATIMISDIKVIFER